MSEEFEAKRDGATLQPNSGRGKTKKGDAVLYPFLIAYKEYEKSFSISKMVWGKICRDAITNAIMEPTIKVILGSGSDRTRVWIVGDKMFHEMREAWLEKYGGE